MTVIMYGIPNCDTIKKAKRWLQGEAIDFEFHDFRKQGIDVQLAHTFCSELGWQNVLNKRGTTYRQLPQTVKDDLDEESAVPLLVEQPAMIKRPILLVNNKYHLGFSVDSYTAIFNS